MLISLSSHTETNPARFSNFFSTPHTIKPFSYVCLIQAGLIRDRHLKAVSIPPDFPINIRFNAYNVHRITLNAGGASDVIFSIPQLVVALNAARPAEAAQQVDGFYEFVVSEVEGYAFELKFFNQNRVAAIKNAIYGAGGSEFYKKQFWNLINGENDTIPTSQNGANRQNIPAVAGTWGLGMAWDEAYYNIPANQVNKNTPSVLLSQNPYYTGQGVVTFQIVNNNVDAEITCGHAITNDATPPLYTSGAYAGSGDKRVWFAFNHTRGLDIRVFNKATGQMEFLNGGVPYDVNPGDRFLLQALNTTDPFPPDQASLGHYSINVFYSARMVYCYTGILGELANRPAGGNFLLSTNQVSPDNQTASNNMSYVYDDNDLIELTTNERADTAEANFLFLFNGNDNTKWNGNTIIGCMAGTGTRNTLGNNFVGVNAGWIYDQSLGRPATFPFLNSGETQVATAQIRNACGVWGFNTWSDGIARASTQVEIPNVFRIQADPMRFNSPTMLVVHTLFGDTTGMYQAGEPNTSHRTLFAHNQANSITIALGQAETWDMEIVCENANPNLPTTGLQLNLTDAGANRIDIKMSTNAANSYNYTWYIQYFGNVGGNKQVRVLCNEQTRTNLGAVTNILFSSPITAVPVNTDQPRSINYMGGANPLDAFFTGGGGAVQYRYGNMAENTMFSHFRIYQNGETANADTTIWDTLTTNLNLNFTQSFSQANSRGVVPAVPNVNFFFNDRLQPLFPTAAQQANIENYSYIPYQSPELTSTWFFRKPTNDTDQGVGYHKLTGSDIANIQIDNYVVSPLNSTQTDLTETAYAGTGQGIVDPTIFDTAIDVESPEIDVNGDFLQNQNYDPDIGINHPLSRVTMDFDVLDIPSEKMKVQLTNLPQNSINGVTNSLDKTIYEIPLIENVTQDNEQEIVEITAPTKCWVALNNAGEIPLNQIDVRIADVENKEAVGLRKDTNLLVEFQDDIRLLN